MAAKPNAGHLAIANLQNHSEVSVITQNIDGLHQRAGSRE
jgi:NAD-dependent deacetylase